MTSEPRRYTAAEVADLIGKTEHWVKRNAHRLPHHRFGSSRVFLADDIADMLAAARVRDDRDAQHTDELRPITGRRTA